MKLYADEMNANSSEPAKPSKMAGFIRDGLEFVIKNATLILIQQLIERFL